ncbi:MAG: nuclear transport factor 2 family protein [Pseudomonadota bacterium]
MSHHESEPVSMSQADAEEFFDAYLAAWNAQDLVATSGFYAEPSSFVLPETTHALHDANATLGFLEAVFERLNREDFGRSTHGAITVKTCNDGVAVMDVRDIARLRKDGSTIETIDAHYVLRHDHDGGWRIVTAVMCRQGWLG